MRHDRAAEREANLDGPEGSWRELVPASDAEGDISSRPSSLEIARRYVHQRRLRRDIFRADVFREPAWDILLDLYCARLSGKEVSIMDACIAAGVPSTTGLRYVRRLLATKLVTLRRDATDRRRSWVELTDVTVAQIESWLQATWPHVA